MVCRRFSVLGVIIIGALIVSCPGKKSPGPAPGWMGPGAPSADENYFYGVGCAEHEIFNYFFQRDTARERARVSLAKAVYTYALSELSGDTAAARRVVESTLPARQNSDSYRNEKGDLCARARLPKKTVDGAIRTNQR